MVMGIGMGLALALPIVLPPALFVWYLNSGGIAMAIRRARASRAVVVEKS